MIVITVFRILVPIKEVVEVIITIHQRLSSVETKPRWDTTVQTRVSQEPTIRVVYMKRVDGDSITRSVDITQKIGVLRPLTGTRTTPPTMTLTVIKSVTVPTTHGRVPDPLRPRLKIQISLRT